MVGELQVTGPKSPRVELAAQGVTREVPVVIWEWAFGSDRIVENTSATFYEGNFIDGFWELVDQAAESCFQF
jgi:hypothetical protein